MNQLTARTLKTIRGAVALATIAASFAVGVPHANADGSESLGPPSVPIAQGSGTSIGGVGLRDGGPGALFVDVPVGATVSQVLLYWEGLALTETAGADATAMVDGIPVTGTLIGGPTKFFTNAWSSSFRADITSINSVSDGPNTLVIGDINFSHATNGAGVVVIWDDGTARDIQLVDGNDLAFVDFVPPLDTTVAQTFSFDAVGYDRVAEVGVHAGSVVGPDLVTTRPNVIEVIVDGTITRFDDVLGSNDGDEWDSITLPIAVPGGATSLSIQLLSEDGANPVSGDLPASMAWVVGGFSLPLSASLGDFVWYDTDEDGVQDSGELGVPNVFVELLDCNEVALDSTTTGPNGEYDFTDLEPGCYKVKFTTPPDHIISPMGQGGNDAEDSNPDPTSGVTGPIDLKAGEHDPTIDAGIFIPQNPGIDIEKLTNGADADNADDADVPQVMAGDLVTWTYLVTNTGNVAFAAADVNVTDDTIPGLAFVAASDSGSDGILSPGETWTYTASGVALQLDAPGVSSTVTVVDGCNPGGNPVPGDRATYENIGTVVVPGGTDSDPSHYCNPPEPGIDIEKLTNGNQADGANDADVPEIAAGDPITWTYVVTNTGDVPFAEADVDVTDDIVGGVTLVVASDDGDGILSPGEQWTYTADGLALQLDDPGLPANVVVVPGCNPAATPVPGDRETYENIGTVVVPGDSDVDPSHYCNPEVTAEPAVHIEKFTKVQEQVGPSGDLCIVNSKPRSITLKYIGGADSVNDQGSKATVDGDPGLTSPVRIVLDSKKGMVFDDIVELGDEFVADSGDKFPSNTIVFIYDLADNLLQTVEFHTSCSVPIALGDIYGAVQLTGFLDPQGGGGVLPDPDPTNIGEDADTPTGPEATAGDTIVWTYLVTNPGELALSSVGVSDDAGTPGDMSDDFDADPILDAGFNVGDTDQNGLLDIGEEWRFAATGTAAAGQYGNLGTVEGTPVDAAGVPTGQPAVSDDDPSHYLGVAIQYVDVTKLTVKKKELKFKLGNTGPDTATIVQMDLVWPEGTNGQLKEIDKVFEPASPVSSPLTITSWDDLNRLDIDSGDEREYKLKFQNTADSDLSNYSILVTFADGSTLTVA